MRCPFCGVDDDRVVDSRSAADGAVIRRRRECLACTRRYTTYERIEEAPLKVVKKDGSRVEFNREKIRQGLKIACEKRPVMAMQIDDLLSEVEKTIHERFEGEISSRQIGEIVMDRLKRLDNVAYVRFASVYRDFKDIDDFHAELEAMRAERQVRETTTPSETREPVAAAATTGQHDDNGRGAADTTASSGRTEAAAADTSAERTEAESAEPAGTAGGSTRTSRARGGARGGRGGRKKKGGTTKPIFDQ